MNVDRDRVNQVLREYEAFRDAAGDPELEAVKAAIFIEDALGITLSDAEIDPDVLGTPEALRLLITGSGDPV